MKYAIPVNSKDENDNISLVLGRSKFFAVYESEKEDFEYYENPGSVQARGAGTIAVQSLADMGVDMVFSVHIGPNATHALENAGIKYQTVEEQSLNDIKKKYLVNDEEED